MSDPRFFELCISLSSISNSISGEFREMLDTRLTKAFELLELSPSWTLLGENGKQNGLENGKCTFICNGLPVLVGHVISMLYPEPVFSRYFFSNRIGTFI